MTDLETSSAEEKRKARVPFTPCVLTLQVRCINLMDQHLYLYQHLGVKVPPLPVCFLLPHSTALFGPKALLEAFKI